MQAETEVVSDHHSAVLVQRFEQPDHITDRVQDGVALKVLRPVCPSEPPLVRCHGAVAGVSEGGELMAP